MDVLRWSCGFLLVMTLYFLLKFIVTSNALAVESKGIAHPSKAEFEMCRKEVIRQRFK